MRELKLFILVILLLNSGCKDACDCFKGTGSITVQERSAGNIRELQLRCNADVIIHPGPVSRLRVTAGSKLIDKLETAVNGDVMIIRNNNHCNWIRSYDPVLTVELWTSALNHIYVDNSSGDITFSDTLHCDNFTFDSYSSLGVYHILLNAQQSKLALHNGPADFYAEGVSAVSYVYDAGYGKMHLEKLKSQFTFMNNRGTNDNYVWASQELEASLEGSGNIYYTGNPQSIKEKITGTGRIIPLQ